MKKINIQAYFAETFVNESFNVANWKNFFESKGNSCYCLTIHSFFKENLKPLGSLLERELFVKFFL
jgi:hypothetical protein